MKKLLAIATITTLAAAAYAAWPVHLESGSSCGAASDIEGSLQKADAAHAWGDHGEAGYASTGSVADVATDVAAVSGRVDVVEGLAVLADGTKPINGDATFLIAAGIANTAIIIEDDTDMGAAGKGLMFKSDMTTNEIVLVGTYLSIYKNATRTPGAGNFGRIILSDDYKWDSYAETWSAKSITNTWIANGVTNTQTYLNGLLQSWSTNGVAL